MNDPKQNAASAKPISAREFLKVQDLQKLEAAGGEDLRRLFNPFAWNLRDEVAEAPSSGQQRNIEIEK